MTGLNRDSSIPLFRQLADILRNLIRQGAYPEGKPLPNMEVIAAAHQVTAVVVRKAFRLLEEEGWTEHGQEEAPLARHPKPAKGVSLLWDPADLRFDGDGAIEVRVLSKVMTSLSREALRVFEVHGRSGHQASRIVKLHRVGGRPMALEQILAPVSELPGLVMKDHRHSNIFRLIEADYGKPLARVLQRIHLRDLTAEEAKTLESVEEFPALAIEQTLIGRRGPIALVEWVVPGGRSAVGVEGRVAGSRGRTGQR